MTEWACAEAVQEEHTHRGRDDLDELIFYTMNSPVQGLSGLRSSSGPGASRSRFKSSLIQSRL